jgi:hypothetical protein
MDEEVFEQITGYRDKFMTTQNSGWGFDYLF